jgi:glycosyltransferase involved in cell wall biosynthesis
VKDGEDGFLVVPRKPSELAERICRLLDDESLRRRMSERLRERAPREFAIEIGCGKVLDAARDALRSSPAAVPELRGRR